jgi:tetrahydromethanopterin S-methyltransferase subunit F
MVASSRSSAPDAFLSSGALPTRTTDLAVCALLSIVTVGLLVLAV